jgi:hypothetical protein
MRTTYVNFLKKTITDFVKDTKLTDLEIDTIINQIKQKNKILVNTLSSFTDITSIYYTYSWYNQHENKCLSVNIIREKQFKEDIENFDYYEIHVDAELNEKLEWDINVYFNGYDNNNEHFKFDILSFEKFIIEKKVNYLTGFLHSLMKNIVLEMMEFEN